MNIIEELERNIDQLLRKPDDAQILNDIGVLLYQLEDWKNAEMYFHRAWELDPVNKDILYNYGLLLYLQFRWQEVLTFLNTIWSFILMIWKLLKNKEILIINWENMNLRQVYGQLRRIRKEDI